MHRYKASNSAKIKEKNGKLRSKEKDSCKLTVYSLCLLLICQSTIEYYFFMLFFIHYLGC